MKNAPIVLTTLFYLVFSNIHAQFGDLDHTSEFLTVGSGIGFMLYNGDLQTDDGFVKMPNVKSGVNLMVEKNVGPMFGLQFNALIGKLGYNEITKERDYSRNFESNILSFNLNALYHFDNGSILSSNASFAPYIGAGIGYTLFDPYGDLKDRDGNTYHYWSDGSIRDLPENDPMAASASYITKDYSYESQLTDSATNYSRGTLSIPITLGIKVRFNDNVQARVFASYFLTQSDWIDNIEANGDNDAFLNTGISLHYTIRKKNPNKISYKDVDMNSIENADTDGDGVKDMDDWCQATPKQVKVDEKGCPLDTDKDRVPDYKDDEPDTEPGALVDDRGVTISDEQINEDYKEYDTGLATEKVEVSPDNPPLTKLNEYANELRNNPTDEKASTTNLNDDLKSVDTDGDGYISRSEVLKVIDDHIKGSEQYTTGSLHILVNYFNQSKK